jgi:Helix-turn-helix domain
VNERLWCPMSRVFGENWTGAFERAKATTDPPTAGLCDELERVRGSGIFTRGSRYVENQDRSTSKLVKRAGRHTQHKLQKILGPTQPRITISDLLRGKMSKFSLEMLLIYAQRLGRHAKIKTTKPREHPRCSAFRALVVGTQGAIPALTINS